MNKYMIADVSQGSAMVQVVGPETGDSSQLQTPRVEASNNNITFMDNNQWAEGTCYKCKQMGHIYYWPLTSPNLRLDHSSVKRRNNVNSKRVGGKR
jgi:hypothetical protein